MVLPGDADGEILWFSNFANEAGYALGTWSKVRPTHEQYSLPTQSIKDPRQLRPARDAEAIFWTGFQEDWADVTVRTPTHLPA